jgi:hypothetical protein
MKLQERSYSTKIMRPKPLVHSEEDGSLVVIATSWGQPEHSQRAIEEVVKYVNAAKADVEVTSPFEFLTCLTDEVNYVRTGLLIANDALYRGENKNQYFSGVEILVLFRRGSQRMQTPGNRAGIILFAVGQNTKCRCKRPFERRSL